MARKKKSLKIPSANDLKKKYKRSGKAEEIILDPEDIVWLPSRFLALNYQLGGGIPYGKILEIYGEESSGKSLLAFDFAYCAQALGGHVLWADAEYSYTKEWATLNGLDNNSVTLYPEIGIERISDWAIDQGLYWRNELNQNQPILMVIDSIAALETEINKNAEQLDKKAEMGNRAKAIGDFLRYRHPFFEDLGICVICINQVRKKINSTMFEDPTTTPGGDALKFFASQRLGVYKSKMIKEKINGKEDIVGRHSTIRLIKNKVSPPRPTISKAPVYFNPQSKHDIGFDKYFEIDEVFIKQGILEKKKGGSVYKMKGKSIARGAEDFKKKFLTDDKLRKRLIRRSSINTISKTRNKIENIKTNLFSVENVVIE